MAGIIQVIRNVSKWRWASTYRKVVGLSAILVLLCVGVSSAAWATPDTPIITGSDWQTGSIQVNYSNVVQGDIVKFYGATYKDPNNFIVLESWVDDGSGTHTVKWLENGQTVWFYLTVVDAAVTSESAPSNQVRQTPPITAYIINWPEMFGDMQGLFDSLEQTIRDGNEGLKDFAKSLVTPSQPAMDGVKQAVEDLKSSIGATAAEDAADKLKTGLDGISNNGSPKIVTDDGVGTFTGGATPDSLPPLIGTANESTWCVVLAYNPFQGNAPIQACLFNDETMEKLKWWSVVYDVISVIPWILLGVWVVQRFTPQFKV